MQLFLLTVPSHNAMFTCVQGGCLAFTPLDGYLKL